jgi:cytoskeletal protein RodZ
MIESELERSELPLDGVGTRLRRAREAAGLSITDVAARTRIAERHLATIEAGKFNALASRAYAIGFTRNYAREVGLDEEEILRDVRAEFDGQEHLADRYQPAAFEPGDPARVPPARLALIAALSALAVLIAGYIFWRSFYTPAVPLPDLATEASDSAGMPAAATAAPSMPAAIASGGDAGATGAAGTTAGGVAAPAASSQPALSHSTRPNPPREAQRGAAPSPSPSASRAAAGGGGITAATPTAPSPAATAESSTVSQ